MSKPTANKKSPRKGKRWARSGVRLGWRKRAFRAIRIAGRMAGITQEEAKAALDEMEGK